MQALSRKPSELSVSILLPCGANIPWQTGLALTRTAVECTKRGVPFNVHVVAGSSVVTWARSKVLDLFLKDQYNFAFFIDSDMDWEPLQFIRVLALASEYGVVCGAYAQKNEAQTIVVRHEDELEVNPHGLVKCMGVGLGFTCLKREIAEQVAATKPLVFDPATNSSIRDVFRLDTCDRGNEHPDLRGEDMAFFADVMEAGHDVWLDPSLILGHIGSRVYAADPRKALGLDSVLQGVFN